MTEPVKYKHHSIAGKPALKACNGRDRTPYGEKVNPIGFGSLVHVVLHMCVSKHKLNRLATVLCRFVWNGKEVVEAQGREPKGLGFASNLLWAGFVLAKNETDVTHLSFRNNPLTNPSQRVCSLSQMAETKCASDVTHSRSSPCMGRAIPGTATVVLDLLPSSPWGKVQDLCSAETWSTHRPRNGMFVGRLRRKGTEYAGFYTLPLARDCDKGNGIPYPMQAEKGNLWANAITSIKSMINDIRLSPETVNG